jgi:hypothetical protein
MYYMIYLHRIFDPALGITPLYEMMLPMRWSAMRQWALLQVSYVALELQSSR